MTPRAGRLAAADFDALLLAGSAGSFDVLRLVLPALSPDLPLPVVCLVHAAPATEPVLARALAGLARLPVRQVEDKEPLVPGTLYCAGAGYHLLLEADRRFALSLDEPVHFARPSIDVLFESAADALGPRTLAVLLSGANADGAAGLRRIRDAGGVTLVQDPATATSPEMPRAAVLAGAATRVLAPEELRDVLAGLAGPASGGAP